MKKEEALKNALKKLGVKRGTKVTVESAGYNRSKVFLNGVYSGIFDYTKKTFVD